MVFIILLLVVFGMVLSTLQFGSAPDGGSVTVAAPRAVVYAQNMETWHQAAMMTLQMPAAVARITTDTNCNPADPASPPAPVACDLNQYLRDKTTFGLISDQTISPLAKYWPEYQPIVPVTNPALQATGGWQSFLIRNINGTQAGVDCSSSNANCTDSYVLTVFRGYGYGGNYSNNTYISNAKGSLDNAQLATALAKTIQDRMGVGNLQCTSGGAGACSFTRQAAYTLAGGTTTSDLALQFPTSAFTPLIGVALPSGQTPGQVFDGLPAIMTRVSSGIAVAPTCAPATLTWGTTNNCSASFSTSSLSGSYNDGTYSGSATAVCNGTVWSVTGICTLIAGNPSDPGDPGFPGLGGGGGGRTCPGGPGCPVSILPANPISNN